MSISLLGGTSDLHAGQFVDRIGVALGLPFPAGPALEKLAVASETVVTVPAVHKDGGAEFFGTLNCPAKSGGKSRSWSPSPRLPGVYRQGACEVDQVGRNADAVSETPCSSVGWPPIRLCGSFSRTS